MAKEKRDAGLIQVKLRMPIAFHRKLMRDADRNGQTLNAEILKRLEGSYLPPPTYIPPIRDEVTEAVQRAFTERSAELTRALTKRFAETARKAFEERVEKAAVERVPRAFITAWLHENYGIPLDAIERTFKKVDQSKKADKEHKGKPDEATTLIEAQRRTEETMQRLDDMAKKRLVAPQFNKTEGGQ
jgi:hypothetical protein